MGRTGSPKTMQMPCQLDSTAPRPHIGPMTDADIMRLIAGLAVLALLWPTIRHLPREGMLAKIALWLAILVGLGLFYQTFGPF